jgi:quinol monooxygenase YgiN
MDALSPSEQERAGKLKELGLPEEAAIKCAKAVTAGPNPAEGSIPVRMYGMMKMKDGADKAALAEALKAYSAASKAAAGQLGCNYGISDSELTMFETFDSKNAMDIHVAHCFEHYVKMLPHVEMTELVCTCDPADYDFWKGECSKWGAKKVVCHNAM